MKSQINPTVTPFFETAKSWKREMSELRKILLKTGLTEELKWHQPCYTLDGKNIAIISAFKNHCIVGFFKGALLKDEAGVLRRPGQNMQSGRHFPFVSMEEIRRHKMMLVTYLHEAIAIERAGLKITPKTTSEYPVPEELSALFRKSSSFHRAFYSLTPGRQRGYLLFFSGAKQSSTRTARIEKCRQAIMAGRGLRD